MSTLHAAPAIIQRINLVKYTEFETTQTLSNRATWTGRTCPTGHTYRVQSDAISLSSTSNQMFTYIQHVDIECCWDVVATVNQRSCRQRQLLSFPHCNMHECCQCCSPTTTTTGLEFNGHFFWGEPGSAGLPSGRHRFGTEPLGISGTGFFYGLDILPRTHLSMSKALKGT